MKHTIFAIASGIIIGVLLNSGADPLFTSILAFSLGYLGALIL